MDDTKLCIAQIGRGTNCIRCEGARVVSELKVFKYIYVGNKKNNTNRWMQSISGRKKKGWKLKNRSRCKFVDGTLQQY